jgi:hypothetical protein
MDNTLNLDSQIKGWGVDLDPTRRPAYPKWKTPPDGTGAHWDQPPQQTTEVKIHKSLERPNLTAVFGTACPPKGLSGLMRDYAYGRFNEAQIRHWMILLLADRVDMVEGILEDLSHGHVPNLYKEMGLAAEWKHNRAGFVRKLAVLTGVGVGTFLLLSKRR